MTDYVRRLVSGNKARFHDSELDVELDLAYITDHVIVMGYPAVGMEGLYRNRREDAQKFLDHRHPDKYWVFNFCPVKENAYDSAIFHGRVSRYPFPDHHAPPLAILPLVAREMRLWIDGGPDRVVVCHCKAGKGRSGTLACAYLLSLDIDPTPPTRQSNYSKKERVKLQDLKPLVPPSAGGETATVVPADNAAKSESAQESEAKKEYAMERAEEFMNEMPEDDAHQLAEDTAGTDTDESVHGAGASASTTSLPAEKMPSTDSSNATQHATSNGVSAQDFASAGDSNTTVTASPILDKATRVESPASVAAPDSSTATTPAASVKSKQASLANVLNLHTARRMVSESSSSSSSSSSSDDEEPAPQEATVPGPPPKKGRAGVSIPSQRRWLWYWSLLLADEGPAGFWPPLPYPPTKPDYDPPASQARARVLDVQVRMRETKGVKLSVVKAASALLERWTDKRAAPGEGGGPGDLWVSVSRYDDQFVETLEQWERWSREQGIGGMGKRRDGGDTMAGGMQTDLKKEIQHIFQDGGWDRTKMVRSFDRLSVVADKESREGKVVTETLRSKANGDGVPIDANREVRFKIYLGKVFLSWFWLIPAFHLPPSTAANAYEPFTLTLAKSDLDFAIGLGASLIEVKVTLQRIAPEEGDGVPKERTSSGDSPVGQTEKIVGGIVSTVSGQTPLRETVETRQGLED